MQDKNYWLQRWYERRFLDRLWKIYPDGEWSWHDVMNYVKSERFQNDLFSDLSLMAQSMNENMFKIGDVVRMKSYPVLSGEVTWISDEIDLEGRCIHIVQNGETYRVNEDSMELKV